MSAATANVPRKLADLVQRSIVSGLAVISVLGLIGSYHASCARLAYAKKLNEEYYQLHPDKRPIERRN